MTARTTETTNRHQAGETPPPEGVVMRMVMGAWVSKTISEVTRLDVPDILKAQGPTTAAELVSDHGVSAHPESLRRALRACASVGIFTEGAEGTFGPNPLSDTLSADSPVSVKKMAEMYGASWRKIWTGLGDALRTGESQAKPRLGMEFWDYLKANPQEMEDFGEAMKSNSNASQRGVVEHCDLSEAKKVVDIGGGFGHLAVALLEKHRGLQAAVLDMPDLIPIAEKNLPIEDPQVACRLERIGGDMFEDPPPAADVYIMKHIIHDWDDASCLKLLRHCHDRMEGDGRVICIDAVLPPMGDTSGTAAKFLDINMLVTIPGKERTLLEWEALYDAAGFKIQSVQPLHDNFGTSIIEGVKK